MKNTKPHGNKEILTGINIRKVKSAYKQTLRTKWFSKNVLPITRKKQTWDEKIIKIILHILLRIAAPRISWKNKPKINELVNRSYNNYMRKDIVFIPISLSFYFLISFVPIITIILILLSALKYNVMFLDVILTKIIPGINSVIKFPESSDSGTQYVYLGVLAISSLWLSASGFNRFVYSQNYIYQHDYLGNWFINQLKGLVIVFCISLYLTGVIIIYLLFFESVTQSLTSSYDTNIFFYFTFSIYLFLALCLGIFLLFKLTPSFINPMHTVIPGVIVSAVPITIFITSFGYLTSIIDYNKYGIIGTFLYISLLVSTMSFFLIIGSIVNEAYYKTYYSSYTIAKKSWLFWKVKF
ncbi:YhjD/YihY/BrkB family envelope integrity protein [Mycoplasmopsis columbinasalis]|uniref:Ribonuclease BN-like family n=1 Tax=Mycoplasmopsis columbinasalis TaxID=114880 RepID=A0A449BA78_9BACT|nr:YhjD/YihY/BrkB family envelope integrity protein [Mycoplasmopsis columbinasalis]VEU78078.1 Ribonuclease BN-like family [Mycoplasmopsis columbinasalis]